MFFYHSQRLVRPSIILFIIASAIFNTQSLQAKDKLQISNARLQAHEQGRKIYNFRCYYCHGYSGDARTLASRFLTPAPRDFTRLQKYNRESMMASIRDGRPGTAMAGFANILNTKEIGLVTDFIYNEFILHKNRNTRYHTAENGWPQHERYRAAYPFAIGEIALDEKPESLSAKQIEGRQLFLKTCITCHDRSKVYDQGPVWEASAVSYPRNNSSFQYPRVDNISEASVYARHDVPPELISATEIEKKGEKIFQDNCAFCHAADGTGKNWIGSFLEPRPRDLTNPYFMQDMSPQRLESIIKEGLTGTTMPAWKDVLSENEIQALIAYINRAFHPLATHTP